MKTIRLIALGGMCLALLVGCRRKEAQQTQEVPAVVPTVEVDPQKQREEAEKKAQDAFSMVQQVVTCTEKAETLEAKLEAVMTPGLAQAMGVRFSEALAAQRNAEEKYAKLIDELYDLDPELWKQVNEFSRYAGSVCGELLRWQRDDYLHEMRKDLYAEYLNISISMKLANVLNGNYETGLIEKSRAARSSILEAQLEEARKP